MNRCFPAYLRRHRLGLVLVLGVTMLTTAWAHAQQLPVRNFPPHVQRGTMVITAPPLMTMNGKPERLSPGARIRNTNNTLLLSASIVGQTLVVNFLREPSGLVHEVWLLSPAEARQEPQ